MKYFPILLVALALLGAGCNPTSAPATDEAPPSDVALAQGFQLLETNCFSCHSPNADIDNRIAPPMEAVKRHYLERGTTRAQFTQDILAFLNNPSKETSKMPGAVKRFGVMPKMSFSEAQITAIAHYIYHTELERPDWFEQHYQGERQKYAQSPAAATPLEKGQQLAMQTKAVLGKNLLGAINADGTEHALAFCNTRAYPLTDSMATALNADIKRVSDKNRNPNNAANATELAYIAQAKEALAKGETAKPHLQEIEGRMVGYYPIMTDKMCLQCHGQTQTEVLPATLTAIQALYPKDKAVGYKANELRGIWVVSMAK